MVAFLFFFFFSSRRRHTRLTCDWSSDVCSSDLDRDGCDAALPDADVARRVQARLRVEHAPAREDEIERLAPRPSPARRERDHGKENRDVGRHHESVRGHAVPYVRAHTARWLVRAGLWDRSGCQQPTTRKTDPIALTVSNTGGPRLEPGEWRIP